MKTTSLLCNCHIVFCLIIFFGLTKQDKPEDYKCDEKSAENITIVIFYIFLYLGRKCNSLHTFS